MATNDVAIPATVTIRGEMLFDLVARFLASFELCLDETERCETHASMVLDHAILDLFSAGFGPFMRECEFGEPDGCRCPACDEGSWEEMHMPLWLLAEKRGEKEKEEWLAHWAAIDSAA